MTDESTKDRTPQKFPQDTWNTRVDMLANAYPEVSDRLIEMLHNLLVELVDNRGLPVPGIYFPEDNRVSIEWVTGSPEESFNEANPAKRLNIANVLTVEMDEEDGYSTFTMNMLTKEAEEKDVSTHDEAVKIISGWNLTHSL